MMTPKQSLIAARALIQDEKNWRQRGYYSDANGNLDCNIKDAECFCAVGALFFVNEVEISSPDSLIPGASLLQRIARQHYHSEDDSMQLVFDFNDRHTHSEVLALFDRAIALCE